MIGKELFTIGHSNDSFEHFLDLLRKNGIDTVVDVRSIPYSRYARQFNKKTLEKSLQDVGIRYTYMGDHLGGKIKDPALTTVDGRVDYARVAKTDRFRQGITRLESGIRKGYRIALMCAEKDPLKCHRFFLISRFLARKGYTLLHIIDEKVVTQDELESKIRKSNSGSSHKQLNLWEQQ